MPHSLLWAVVRGVRAGGLWGLHAGFVCRRELLFAFRGGAGPLSLSPRRT